MAIRVNHSYFTIPSAHTRPLFYHLLSSTGPVLRYSRSGLHPWATPQSADRSEGGILLDGEGHLIRSFITRINDYYVRRCCNCN